MKIIAIFNIVLLILNIITFFFNALQSHTCMYISTYVIASIHISRLRRNTQMILTLLRIGVDKALKLNLLINL